MARRLQVFVSSTYLDLKEERQAAVQAILEAKHIPAGMELFAAGNDSQLEVIKKWIDESDVYMLILGHRYGSIEPKSKKSYTRFEYDYAVSEGKKVFAVVMTDGWRIAKQATVQDPNSLIELENPKELKAFRKVVMGRMCKQTDDHKDIKIAVLQALADFAHDKSLMGWVRGDVDDKRQELEKEISRLSGELSAAQRQNTTLEARLAMAKKAEGPDWEAIQAALMNIKTDLTPYFSEDAKADLGASLLKELENATAFWALQTARTVFVNGVHSRSQNESLSPALFYEVAPHLRTYGLIEDVKVPASARYQTVRLSQRGLDFLIWLDQQDIKNSAPKS